MNDKRLTLTGKQYDSLLCILSIRPSNSKNLLGYVDDLISTLPPSLIKDINQKMKMKVDNKTDPNIYLEHLITIDSQKRRAERLSSEFEEISIRCPDLMLGVLDLIFKDNDFKAKKLGKLIKSRIALGSARAGLAHRNTFYYYLSLFIATSSFESEDVIRTYLEKKVYSKDIIALSKMAESTNRSANSMAVSYADETVLHYLVNVKNKSAVKILEERMSGLRKG